MIRAIGQRSNDAVIRSLRRHGRTSGDLTVLPAVAVPAINVLLPAWAESCIVSAAPIKRFVTVPPPLLFPPIKVHGGPHRRA